MLYISDKQFATVWEVEDKGNYASARISTGRKDKNNEGKYINSNWFARFVGEAYKKIDQLEPKTRIILKGAGISQEAYMVEDEKKWPKYAQVVIFNFELAENSSKPSKNEERESVEESTGDEELPF